jgi:hypothetical protein
MKTHPIADIFPMMEAEELNDLAADIKANGLLNPLVTWVDQVGTIGDKGEEYLIDGRNRQAACKIAGVKPVLVPLDNGHDPSAFIVGVNINRRHMTKGQRAMAVAMIYPEPEKGGRGKKLNPLISKEFNAGALSQARTVLKHTPECAKYVLSGNPPTPLSAAYVDACRVRDNVGTEQSQLERLRKVAPDLAELVTEERMRPGEAIAALEKRERDERDRRKLVNQQIEGAIDGVNQFHEPAREIAADYDPEMWSEKYSVKRIKRAIEFLQQFMKAME